MVDWYVFAEQWAWSPSHNNFYETGQSHIGGSNLWTFSISAQVFAAHIHAVCTCLLPCSIDWLYGQEHHQHHHEDTTRTELHITYDIKQITSDEDMDMEHGYSKQHLYWRTYNYIICFEMFVAVYSACAEVPS